MKKVTTSSRLKDIMASRNLKQVDILRMCAPYCEKYGIKLNKNDLSQYVSGKVTPGQDKLTILGLALGVNEVWLMGYDSPTAADPSHAQRELSPDESELIDIYRDLDDRGKGNVMDTAKREYSYVTRGDDSRMSFEEEREGSAA